MLPEPAELVFLDVGEGGTGFGCWRRRFSGLVGGRRSFFVKRHRVCCPFKEGMKLFLDGIDVPRCMVRWAGPTREASPLRLSILN